MPWSTTRNKGPSRYVLRIIILVVLAWGLIYHFNFNQRPNPKTLNNFLHSTNGEDQGQDESQGHGQFRRPTRPSPKTNANNKADSSQVNIAAKGPQIGQTQVDIGVKQDKDSAASAQSQIDVGIKHDKDSAVSPQSQIDVGITKDKGSATSAQKEEPYIPLVNIAPPPEPVTPEPWEKERYDAPGEPIKHVVLTRSVPHNEPPSLLILMMTRDAQSWGREGAEQRDFKSFLNLLSTSGLDLKTCALGMLTSSEDEFKSYERELDADKEQFGAAFLVLHPGYAGREKGDGEEGRANRHDNDVQHARRSEMARLRNYLMLTALPLAPTAAEVLWLDSDVYEVSEGLFQDMRRGMKDHRVGVMTAISIFGGGDWGDYDLNAWRGERTTPNEQERAQLRIALGSWTASPVGEGKSEHMGHIIPRLDREEWERKVEAGEIPADSTEKYFEWDPRLLAQEEEKERAEEEERRKKEEQEEGRWSDGEGEGEGEDQGQNGDGDAEGEDQQQEEDGGDQKDGEEEGDGGEGVGEGQGDGDGEGDINRDGPKLVKRKVTKKKKTGSSSGTSPSKKINNNGSKKKNTNNTNSKPKKKKKEHEKVEVEGFFRLDSVGGTVLMLKAGVVRQGLTFATSYLVGTDWQNEGWDGVETEGLCVTARTLGSGCWGIRRGHSHHCVG